ncbi:MAG: NirD/YgiW/YdeI family stress tolerance protein [Desulfovibrio sp.]|nr:NirD/YgiW/YdeI family stress tolerance protein [Desulfovibrio sp.]
MRMVAMLLALTLGLAGGFYPDMRASAAGFEGPGVASTITSAADVLDAQDDAPCVLEGYILEKLPRRKNRYLFEDGSGRVVVEIKNGIFGHLTVTPRDKVRLLGHVDWNRKRPNEVEADALAIIGTVDTRDTSGR